MCNFDRMLSVIAAGDVVKVVKKLGSIKSSYLIYLDNRPKEILHLGVVKSEDGKWHPETFLINRQRNVSAYIDNQIQVEVLKRYVVKSRQEKMPDDELFEYMV